MQRFARRPLLLRFRRRRPLPPCGIGDGPHFEPGRGHGPVARATLYFLVRYPGEIDAPHELTPEQIELLKQWSKEDPPGQYERHRNQAIFAVQGNRNPFIDHPQWVDLVDFALGLGPRERAQEPRRRRRAHRRQRGRGHRRGRARSRCDRPRSPRLARHRPRRRRRAAAPDRGPRARRHRHATRLERRPRPHRRAGRAARIRRGRRGRARPRADRDRRPRRR
ncbi:endonuclease [Nannocystis pusilla]|uniref:endonuclease n=1 Tax=Nannocystis pusilla TaxID=889268 RepID=UPI003B7F9708